MHITHASLINIRPRYKHMWLHFTGMFPAYRYTLVFLNGSVYLIIHSQDATLILRDSVKHYHIFEKKCLLLFTRKISKKKFFMSQHLKFGL